MHRTFNFDPAAGRSESLSSLSDPSFFLTDHLSVSEIQYPESESDVERRFDPGQRRVARLARFKVRAMCPNIGNIGGASDLFEWLLWHTEITLSRV